MFDRKSVPGGPERSNAVTDDNPEQQEENALDVDELLVEEVSIDGMCGVY